MLHASMRPEPSGRRQVTAVLPPERTVQFSATRRAVLRWSPKRSVTFVAPSKESESTRSGVGPKERPSTDTTAPPAVDEVMGR